MATYIALVEIWIYRNGLENPSTSKETLIYSLKEQKPDIELGVSFEIKEPFFIPGRGNVRVFFTPLKFHSDENVDVPDDTLGDFKQKYRI